MLNLNNNTHMFNFILILIIYGSLNYINNNYQLKCLMFVIFCNVINLYCLWIQNINLCKSRLSITMENNGIIDNRFGWISSVLNVTFTNGKNIINYNHLNKIFTLLHDLWQIDKTLNIDTCVNNQNTYLSK